MQEFTKTIPITRLYKDGRQEHIQDCVIREQRIALYLNGKKLLSSMSLPQDQDAYAVGFLMSEGVIESIHDIQSVEVAQDGLSVHIQAHINEQNIQNLCEEVEVSGAILERLAEGEVARSPGMKYKHYAPKADITLLNGSFDQFKAYLEAHAAEHPACLCFTGEGEKLGVPYIEYGREGDGEDQAKHLFRCLRALDEQGDRVVYARCPEKDGLSMAVYNRLIRAAAFRVIDL